ncbi:futalosine hydrolase [Paenibacillus allorhizosphaerae]|uniref:Futalosine hydrolase n=1 Tax=Paenibacillus allorhizosphaerae TaxID=2849866 RepID=A0ABM8VKC7_9BACL|nr:futalosine hydrolase [Paenibacillus allorhizosphaerae]CAG7646879.1 Futalosine hydrolase [Paenibacillus allorhizosphaerae]
MSLDAQIGTTDVTGLSGAGTRILIVTSVAAEKEAVERGLAGKCDRIDVIVSGVGSAATAARTAAALALSKAGYGLVINAGIAGGFAGRAEIGTVVIASEIVAADLGAQSPDGFISLDELGFGSARAEVDGGSAARLTGALLAAGLPAVSGPVLTVSTVTGTAEGALELSGRVPGAAAEAMEGYGAAVAARHFGLPILEIRAVSNAVGPRDRSAWRIKEALDALETVSSIIAEVFS